MFREIIKVYSKAIVDIDRERALKVVHDAADQGLPQEDMLFSVVIIPAIELMIKSISETFDDNLAQRFMTSRMVADDGLPNAGAQCLPGSTFNVRSFEFQPNTQDSTLDADFIEISITDTGEGFSTTFYNKDKVYRIGTCGLQKPCGS